MNDFSTIEARFRAERKRLGMSQDETALAMGVSRGSVVACEAGRSDLGFATLERARRAGMDTWWIQTGQKRADLAITEDQWRVLMSLTEGVERFVAERSLDKGLAFQIQLLKMAYEGVVQNSRVASAAPSKVKRRAQ